MHDTPVRGETGGRARRHRRIGLEAAPLLGALLAVFGTCATFDAALSNSFQRRRPPAFVPPPPERAPHGSGGLPQGGLVAEQPAAPTGPAIEAPSGFDGLTNGFTQQGPAFAGLTHDNVVPLRSHNDNRFLFEFVETAVDGLGPTFNAQSCRECHQNVVTGGASQIAELRSGRTENGRFFESSGGTLIQSRAVDPDIVERVAAGDGVQALRISTNTLGSGFVEAIANETLLAIRDRQPEAMRGTASIVPVLEAGGRARVGRFGWKAQHASLESFSADGYLNEMGITNPLFPEENTSAGRWVGFGSAHDQVPDPEDDGTNTCAFADFMRATKAPPRGRIDMEVRMGETVFERIGCSTCHVPAMRTAPVGAAINGGRMRVPEALGDRIVRPFSDFLLHDVGTGDGIPVMADEAYAATARQMRTAPLWGLRTRNRLMHDGASLTREDAIRRHAGQATPVTQRFLALQDADRRRLLAFLDSL
jgi:hypothetical protein